MKEWYHTEEMRIMKKIKNNYTNFILTVIAVAMIGILFKGEKIITSVIVAPSAFAVYTGTTDEWAFTTAFARRSASSLLFGPGISV